MPSKRKCTHQRCSLLALELGRPMIISDDDCDTEYPSEELELESTAQALDPARPLTLLAYIHVSRLVASLARLCRSLCITNDAKRRFETQMTYCEELFPPTWQINGTGTLDPLELGPIVHFQNVRLLLHRHNMSPANSQEQRSSSIARCTQTAQDTAKVLHRCLVESDRPEQFRQQIRLSTTSFICTHVWRCMLFLAFAAHWEAFDLLLRYCAIVGPSRAINVSCGRHLDLFLNALVEKHQLNSETAQDEDEDLIVLLSADLQAGTSSWVWATGEAGTTQSRRSKHNHIGHESHQAVSPSSQVLQLDSQLPQAEVEQWDGWTKIHEMAEWLREKQDTMQAIERGPQHAQYGASGQQSSAGFEVNKSAETTRARMTIASITDL